MPNGSNSFYWTGLSQHRATCPHKALRTRPRPRILASGAMEFWSTGVLGIVGIAPRARGVGSPFRERSFVPKPRSESFRPWAILLRHFMATGPSFAIGTACHLPAGQMIPVATGLSLTSNCRRSRHKVRPCPLDLAQEKVSHFRSDFGGLFLLNQVFQTASPRASDVLYRSPAVFGTLSTEVIHYSYFPSIY